MRSCLHLIKEPFFINVHSDLLLSKVRLHCILQEFSLSKKRKENCDGSVTLPTSIKRKGNRLTRWIT